VTRRAVVVWFALQIAAGALGHAQDQRLKARLGLPTAAAVAQLVDSARRLDLPTEPLIQKALEGQTKGAQSDRIVAAVASLLTSFTQARSALGAVATAEDLRAGVLWLRAGGSGAALARVRAAAPGRSLTVPLAVSAELIGRGWPPSEAAATLEQLFRARLTDADFLTLRAGVETAVRGGAGFVPAVRAEVARLAPSRPPE
jgi:hypothetical protein